MRALILAACLVAVSTSFAWALPPGQPPKAPGAPPPAWLEKPGADRWLAYSSFCWTTTCVDFLPPQMRTDLPRIQVVAGTLVRFHLGFRPAALVLRQIGASRTWRLTAARVSTWRAASRGVYVLEARVGGRSAGYAFRIA